jgi:hypothetical protein
MPWDVKMCHWGRVRSAMSFFRKWCAKIHLTSIPFRLKTYRKGQFLDEVDDLFFHVPNVKSSAQSRIENRVTLVKRVQVPSKDPAQFLPISVQKSYFMLSPSARRS